MSFFKKQPEYLDRQANASKAREALLEKFRSKTETDEDFAKRQAALMEIRVPYWPRRVKSSPNTFSSVYLWRHQ